MEDHMSAMRTHSQAVRGYSGTKKCKMTKRT